jgi:MFS family permease
LFPVPYGNGVFGFHWFNFYNALCFQIIVGAPVVLLAKDLGANSTILGVIASFTPLLTILQLPAARFLGRHSYRSFALAGWTTRILFIAIAAMVPLLGFFSRGIRLGILLFCLFCFSAIRGFSSAAFLPWVTGIVPSEFRGRFISLDHFFINSGSVLIMLVSALLMAGQSEPWRYSLVLWVSVAGAAVSLVYLGGIPEGRHSSSIPTSSARVPLSSMLRNVPFRNSMLFGLLFTTVAGGLGVFPVEYLKMQAGFSTSAIYALSAGTFLAPLFILQRVGRWVDRRGSIPMLRLATGSFGVVLLFWFAMSAGILPHGWGLVFLLNITGGMAMAAFNMANLHFGMSVVPAEGKIHYFAVSTVIINLATGIVPVVWGVILDSLGGLDLVEGPLHLRRHSFYFLGIALLSFAALASSRILIRPDPKSPEGG